MAYPKTHTMVARAETEGAYGFPREVELLRRPNGTHYARANGFRWTGNTGSFVEAYHREELDALGVRSLCDILCSNLPEAERVQKGEEFFGL